MKRTLTAATVAICSLLAFMGCKKGDSSTPPTTTIPPTVTGKPYNMSATIGGASFSRDSCSFSFPNLIDTTKIEIAGWAGYPTTRSDYYPIVYLYSSSYHGIGTYTFLNPGNNYGVLTSSASASEYATVGSMTITSIYPTVVGTFSFTTYSGIVVSGGSFTALRQ